MNWLAFRSWVGRHPRPLVSPLPFPSPSGVLATLFPSRGAIGHAVRTTLAALLALYLAYALQLESPQTAAVTVMKAQLNDFIRRGVADALTTARAAAAALTPDRVLAFVGRVYEQAFGILQIMGDAEAESA
ncbi:FUSC family protein [Azospirillum sp. B4]|uniref:FUSC family protein n=1 Tax=Azospirillum sp. B4 TaxID=95605 RepID=UPI000349B5F9|nr:FUSC family protein [Azospirillum sp. B4]